MKDKFGISWPASCHAATIGRPLASSGQYHFFSCCSWQIQTMVGVYIILESEGVPLAHGPDPWYQVAIGNLLACSVVISDSATLL